MSLIVAAADVDVSGGLMGRVDEIAAGARACGDLATVLEACGQSGAPDCVICADPAWARSIAEAYPRQPVVLAVALPPDCDLLLGALRAGLADVWALPMAQGAMQERLRAIRARAVATATAAERDQSRYRAELERDLRAGRYVQMSMLPQSPLTIGSYRFQHRIVPSMLMSGDFVDYFRVTDRVFVFYLADVSGHGASSAFVTVLLKSFSRRLRRESRPDMLAEPGRILEWINTELLEQRIDKHVAVILGVGDLETHEIALVNAGHYPPALRVTAEGPEIVRQKGRPVGLFDTVSYQARTLKMQPGDRLVLFSDGVLDTMGAGALAEKETQLLAAAGAGADVMDVWAGLPLEDARTRTRDDMTCFVVQREN